jgi:hypothetical protein
MAMNGNGLGSEIAEAIMNAEAPPEVKADVVALWKKIGSAIVDHITKNAEVPAGIGVQAGPYSGSTTGMGKVK